MNRILGSLIIIFGFAVISGNSWADSRDIPTFPVPLRWGMTKKEIMKVISEKNLHIATASGKHLQKSSFAYGKYYEWAAIKEETLKYMGRRRFIILRLNENDRLVAISMKLKGGGLQGVKSEIIQLKKKLGKCRGVDTNNPVFKITGCVWLINKSMWLESQLEFWKRKNQFSSYIILHWKKS